VSPKESYPHRLEQALNQEGVRCQIINAGISGDTCRGVRKRLKSITASRPHWVILEIGINDFLMGALPERIKTNIGDIVQELQHGGIPVILAAMEVPPMGDPQGEKAFAALYPDIAATYGLPLIPGFLNPVFKAPGRVQYDGLHPNGAGYEAITRRLLPYVRRALADDLQK
jgi:acyl-CoA thioesterase-1